MYAGWYIVSMKGNNMKRVALFVTQELIEALKKEHQRTGAPIAEIVRRAIVAYLKIPRQ
jgi:predicted DNA-binding protein